MRLDNGLSRLKYSIWDWLIERSRAFKACGQAGSASNRSGQPATSKQSWGPVHCCVQYSERVIKVQTGYLAFLWGGLQAGSAACKLSASQALDNCSRKSLTPVLHLWLQSLL